MDPEVLPADRERYPHGKLIRFRECQIQAIFVPMTVPDTDEQPLTMLGSAATSGMRVCCRTPPAVSSERGRS